MKHLLLSLLLTTAALHTVSAQTKFSDETKKFIEYSDSVIAIRNVLLIDGKGNPSKANQTLILNHGTIAWVGDDAKANIPKAATIINGEGKSVMPGLVMLHEHMYISAHAIPTRYLHLKQLPFTFPRLYLACGATTIRTCGSVEPYSDLRIKKDIDEGMLPGPSMELTAPYIEGKTARSHRCTKTRHRKKRPPS